MELSQQVTSLELSKRLKELGVKQESLFYWASEGTFGRKFKSEYKLNDRRYIDIYEEIRSLDYISAFTATELGEMLPKLTVSCLTLNGKKEESAVCYLDTSFESKRVYKMADTEADARAKMLIYLLENKLIVL